MPQAYGADTALATQSALLEYTPFLLQLATQLALMLVEGGFCFVALASTKLAALVKLRQVRQCSMVAALLRRWREASAGAAVLDGGGPAATVA